MYNNVIDGLNEFFTEQVNLEIISEKAFCINET